MGNCAGLCMSTQPVTTAYGNGNQKNDVNQGITQENIRQAFNENIHNNLNMNGPNGIDNG